MFWPSSLSRYLLSAGTALWLASTTVIAAPGDTDPSFGVDGLVLHTPGSVALNLSNTPSTVISLSDGTLLVAGHSENGQTVSGVADTDILLARYRANGQLDTRFGHQGIVTTATSTAYSRVSGMLEQADGKLLVYGIHAQLRAADRGLVVRYLPDGRLDPGFADGGILSLTLGSGYDQINAAIQQADGKIVVAGAGLHSDDDFVLARLNNDGSLDTTFGTDGLVITDFGGSHIAYDLIAQNGKLVAVGSGGNGVSGITIARYLANGTLDTGFDGDGFLNLDVTSGYDAAFSAFALSNGQLLVGARTGGTQSSLLRFNDDGSQDLSYSLLGLHLLSGQSGVMALRGLANGKLLAMSRNNQVAQLNADGTVDEDFASAGETAALSDMSEASDIIALADGHRILLGRTPSGSIVLARRQDDGALDESFDGDSGSGNGIVINQPRHIGSATSLLALLSQDDGKTIAIGYANNGDRDITLSRYLPDGQLDTSFGTDGVSFLGGVGAIDTAGHAIWQGDKILVAGRLGNYAIVARFNNDGSLDTSFGANGFRQLVSGSSTNFHQLQLLDDGRIFAVGQRNQDAYHDFYAVMLTANGALDSNFGNNGTMQYNILEQEYAKGAVAVSGQFLLIGQSRASFSSSYSLRVLRINADGTVDTSFGSNGSLLHSINNPSIGQVITDSNGKALIAGTSSSDMFVMRLNTDGSKDDSFGSQGTTRIDINGDSAGSQAITEQADGKIVIAGYTRPGSHFDFALHRLHADGTADTTFAESGTLTLDLYGDERLFAVTQQADGKLVTGGYARNFAQFALLRVEALLDSDDDGTPDVNDAFPNDPTETTDTDNDGTGDNSDAFVTNDAAATDDDGDGFPDSWNNDCDSSCQNSSGLTLDPSLNDVDNDGLVDSEDDDNNRDNQPPTVTAPTHIAVNATGDLTEIMLGEAAATDLVDGSLSAVPQTPDNATTLSLAPGRHLITWQATDSAGNIGSATQQVDITPLAGFTTDNQISGEGNSVTVTVTLNGDAPVYPVVIPVILNSNSTATSPADHNATATTIVINEDAEPVHTGSLTFTTTDDGVGGEYDETVILDLVADNGSDTLENAVIDDALSRHIITITEMNVAPTLTSVTLSQGDDSIDLTAGTPTLYERFHDAGNIQLTANMTDPNPQDSHTFEWVINDVVQPETGNTLLIDMDLYSTGEYLLSVTVSDNGNPPLSSAPLKGGVALTDSPAPYGGDQAGGSSGGGSLGWLLMLLGAAGGRRVARRSSGAQPRPL
ncbi:hypothetical protein [Alcanivorax sp.]|uniref:hypothetical protein n=1 Tax=Alcanivorax sp. TaxID=1872427 RepID=UPI000C4A3713|nr:hypothetical protein [Alcanivorax sp.]MBQ23729.1 hypothetical protein [Alcanivorax sp.]